MSDWYDTHSVSPYAVSEREFIEWAQDIGAYVDLAGNVYPYGEPEPGAADAATVWHYEGT